MHSAPFRIDTRRYIIFIYVTTHEEFNHHNPEQTGKGDNQGNQEHQRTDANEPQKAGGHEKLADFREDYQP